MINIDDVTVADLKELSEALLCDLDLFEVLREPRFVSTEESRTEATLETSALREELSCAICFGIINKCVVIKACLHRFCTECIGKAMRVGANECPKCRTRVPSKRSLVPDPLYDQVIMSIIPNLKAFEEMSDIFLMASNKGIKNDPTVESIKQSLLAKASEAKADDASSYM